MALRPAPDLAGGAEGTREHGLAAQPAGEFVRESGGGNITARGGFFETLEDDGFQIAGHAGIEPAQWHGIGLAHLIVKTQPATIPTAFGEILVSGVQLLRRIRPHQGSAISFTQSIPPDLGLVGLAASVQGICTGDTTSLSNALDLVLGF